MAGPVPTTAPSRQLGLLLAERLGQQVGHRHRRDVEGGVVTAQPLLDEETVEATELECARATVAPLWVRRNEAT